MAGEGKGEREWRAKREREERRSPTDATAVISCLGRLLFLHTEIRRSRRRKARGRERETERLRREESEAQWAREKRSSSLFLSFSLLLSFSCCSFARAAMQFQGTLIPARFLLLVAHTCFLLAWAVDRVRHTHTLSLLLPHPHPEAFFIPHTPAAVSFAALRPGLIPASVAPFLARAAPFSPLSLPAMIVQTLRLALSPASALNDPIRLPTQPPDTDHVCMCPTAAAAVMKEIPDLQFPASLSHPSPPQNTNHLPPQRPLVEKAVDADDLSGASPSYSERDAECVCRPRSPSQPPTPRRRLFAC